MTSFTESQLRVLRAFVDTAVPTVHHADDPTGFWARPGSAVGADRALAARLATLSTTRHTRVVQLLDGLSTRGFADQPASAREQMLTETSAMQPGAAAAIHSLRGLSCLLAHSLSDENGRNPFWAQYGYPGAQIRPVQQSPYITPYVPAAGEILNADVVVVGSGAGGGTIAGLLAVAGKQVVVLEAGRATSERDYRQDERQASRDMLYRQGITGTADGNVGLLAGWTLGGGTTVNWQNCLAPPAAVRREWAESGLQGLDGDDFDKRIEAVLTRLGANDRCSDLNGPHQRLVAGAEALGWSWHVAVRNVDPDSYDPVAAGYTQFGDPSGSKRGTLNTYLRDACDHGAVIVTDTYATRILTEKGSAAGVEATWRDPDGGESRSITVRARDVVVACGALETPALLLRTGIGGPATGKHLVLHPCTGIFGVYGKPQDAWWGPPQAAVVDQFCDLGDGYGFLMEGTQFYPGLIGLQLARSNGIEAKNAMSRLRYMSHLMFILRDRHGGEVTVDHQGRAVAHYSLDDPHDLANYRRALRALVDLHLAAGASELWLSGAPVFRRGEDLRAWSTKLDALPVGAGGLAIGSAHQMGTARMGRDPSTSVADTRGELHDVTGVWVGDTSAFPSASGSNPMLSCMALAHRTATHILQGRRNL